MGELPIEFVVYGTPRTPQTKSAKSRADWAARVQAAAQEAWGERQKLAQGISVTLIYFHEGETPLDVDNFIKPILDAMSNIVFADDALVEEVRSRKTELVTGFSVENPSGVLTFALSQPRKFCVD